MSEDTKDTDEQTVPEDTEEDKPIISEEDVDRIADATDVIADVVDDVPLIGTIVAALLRGGGGTINNLKPMLRDADMRRELERLNERVRSGALNAEQEVTAFMKKHGL